MRTYISTIYQIYHHHLPLPQIFFSHSQSSPPTTHRHPNDAGCRNHHFASFPHSLAAVVVSSPRPWRLLCSGCNSWAVSIRTPHFAPSLKEEKKLENIQRHWNKRIDRIGKASPTKNKTMKHNMPGLIQRSKWSEHFFAWSVLQVPSRGGFTWIIMHRHASSCIVMHRHECMNVWMYECMNVWMYECMNVWMYECMNAWMYECMNACITMHRHSPTFVGNCFVGRNNTCTRWPWGTCPRPAMSKVNNE